MHEEDERPPNEKSHAYHLRITYNGCDFFTDPPAILALPKCLFKGWRLKFCGFNCEDPVLVIAIETDRHCTTMRTKMMRNIRNAQLIVHSIYPKTFIAFNNCKIH